MELLGRAEMCATLDTLLDAVRGGQSRSLVLYGEAGVGKSALLDYLADRAEGCRILRASGVEAEMELAFATLHQLCLPVMSHVSALPEPQADALGTAFGLRAGPPPDPFLVCLAALGLLAAAAEESPLVCVIDDAQWLDEASAKVLAFVSRRLFVESVACVFALRDAGPGDAFAGLPALEVHGLGDRHARTLLSAHLPGPMDGRVRDRIIAEARGNPLALIELPRESFALSAGGGHEDSKSLSGRLENGFRRQWEELPVETRKLLLLASAEPLGDLALLWRAADILSGVGASAAGAVEDMIDFEGRVRFRHPLVRSAVYQAASAAQRREVHRALAEATDVETDPDRRAWHRANGTARPDEDIAAELERSAGRAQARGGLFAAAAFLERASALTPDPLRRAERLIATARAKYLVGEPEAALSMLTSAGARPLDEVRRAEVEVLRAEIAMTSGRGASAPQILLGAARRLAPHDPGRARDTYLHAMLVAVGGRRTPAGTEVREVAAAIRAAWSPPETPTASDLALDALVRDCTEDPQDAAPAIRASVRAFMDGDATPVEAFGWTYAAFPAALCAWDDVAVRELADRFVGLLRGAGALAMLPMALTLATTSRYLEGDLDGASILHEEMQALVEASGARTSYGVMVRSGDTIALAAWRGRRAEAETAVAEVLAEATAHEDAGTIMPCHWFLSILYNGLGLYDLARDSAERAAEHTMGWGPGRHWSPAELVEAGVRSGDREAAARGLARLSATTRAAGTSWARGVEARSRALLSEGAEADGLYRAAIDLLGRSRMRVDLARAHLVYGEWLRRERRRTDAREHLRTAVEMLTEMGLDGFADRASRELEATGETARKRVLETAAELTPQESQIARLARSGLTNKEVAERLFVSPRTVEYHLRKVFAKLGVTSRAQLPAVP
ncbi:regulatory LuxR family protein [Actinocorallia herbida]|uniref:Regulatory LuxR family protein n=1 Tax=Actinocorallia herbida TaxID=58109 RepID=A0A3N1D3X4_9ACTN|nr:regulatory LuxR family protein [Actinocorallia herbida]